MSPDSALAMVWPGAGTGMLLLAIVSVLAALLTIWAKPEVHRSREPEAARGALVMALVAAAAVLAGAMTGLWAATGVMALLTLLGAGAIALPLRRLTAGGLLMMVVAGFSLPVTALWMGGLFADQGFPAWARLLFWAGILLGLGPSVARIMALLVHDAALTHRHWAQPHQALMPRLRGVKVSVHLPCHAEPPAVVIATLDALAQQDYADFEVLVCDNNTADPALWQPLAAHVEQLNRRPGQKRFRFFHVEPITGAKAGALNYLLQHMAADTELVAVIDADYLAEPGFLSRLVGHFEDPAVGYVQTPHDYRDFAASAYLRGCYWEYMPANRVSFPGLNEYGCAVTIGTMCLIRAEALVRAGGWAEWCLSEDSELSVRLRGLGFKGVYVDQTFGRGLIPGTFADYRKQRFRWMAGPVQQVVTHWRLLLPRRLGGIGALGGWSKLLEVERSLGPVMLALNTVLGTTAGIVAGALTAGGALPRLALPAVGWWALGLATLASIINGVTRYRLAGCARPGDVLRAALARMSLSWVTIVAGMAGLGGRELAWHRTPKFVARQSGLGALRVVWQELVLGLAFLALGAAMAVLNTSVGRDLALVTALSALLGAARFLAAPAMVLMSEARLESAPWPAVEETELRSTA